MAVNTPAPDPADLVTGILLQITQHAEQVTALDQREAAHFHQIAGQLDELGRGLAETRDRLDAVHDLATAQSALPETLQGLDEQLTALTARLTRAADTAGNDNANSYQPTPGPRWWKLDGAERDEALDRLRAWVEQVYRPGYGHLAALAPCWEQHPLCLYGLDWLMELWSALYLNTERQTSTLASQAEWQTRLLPALAEQIYIETTRCEHTRLPFGTRKPAIDNVPNRPRPADETHK
jgi:hypothetical protein